MKDDLDTVGRDPEVSSLLRLIDPASTDPNYWMRFQSWVLENAVPELARRRIMADLTVADVLTSWSRTLVPAALLAAALAGLVLVRDFARPVPAPTSMGMEELLVEDIEDETIPVALDSDESGAAVVFAGERF